jgi:hypothetical protein
MEFRIAGQGKKHSRSLKQKQPREKSKGPNRCRETAGTLPRSVFARFVPLEAGELFTRSLKLRMSKL